MKKILQSVALALAAFLTVQPALATMTCAQKICADGSSSPDCCLPSSDASMPDMADMAMPSMSASGQAPSNPALVGLDCASDPCCAISARSTPLVVGPVKSRVDGVVPVTRLGGVVAAIVPDRMTAIFAEVVPTPRDRPVLFQVFRI
jgi:hypothetical protein